MSESKNIVNVVRNTDMGVIKLSQSDSSLLKHMNGTPHSNGPLTPMSPCSLFTSSMLEDIPRSIFSAVVLSYWDNILGPRVQHVWGIENIPFPKPDILTHVSGQVLSSELVRDLYTSAIDYKFYNLPEKGILVSAFVFSAKGNYGLGIHSISVIIPSTHLKAYLGIHDNLQCCFRRIVTKLRLILDRTAFQDAVKVISSYMTDCLQVLSFLYSGSLIHSLKFSETAFSPDHVLEKDFLCRCIASHLMTFGRSLVVGETADRINLVLHTLSLFNSKSERWCSLPVNALEPRPYHHDLYLQGMLKAQNGSYLPMTEILVSQYPTTIIDLTVREVRQSLSYDEHILHNFETCKNELICLQYGHFENLVVLEQDLQPSLAFPDTLVQEFVTEVFELPESCWVREAYITHFLRLLQKKALSLIEYVKTESSEGSQILKPGAIKKMRQDLSLNTEGDYRIILATAEKLKPGIFCFLMGDKRYEREQISNLEVL